ncbi:MAG: ABC transporter permease [Denitrovibrio sp.]|nr:MAG: ABC transporter permease [Denitrovibrio sp.]
MNIFTLPVKNLKRKLMRTTILVAVFTVGILSVVMLYNVSETIGHSLEKKMTQFGANVLVYPKSDSLNVSYGGFSLGNLNYQVKYLSEKEVMYKVRNIEFKENISTVAPKLVSLTKYDGKPVAVTGVIWGEETRIKSYWSIDGKMPEQPDEAIIGSRAAEFLGIAISDSVNLGNGVIKISGILQSTGTEDDNLIFADLHTVQAYTGKQDMVNFVEVAALCAGCPIEDIVAQIQAELPDTDINALQNIVKQRMSTINYVKNMVLLVSGVILVIACFMLAMFMLASVNERKKEIGLLRAVGYSGSKIFLIFGFEAMIIGCLAGVLGYIGGYFSSVELLARVNIGGEGTEIAFSAVAMFVSAGLVGLLSVVSASIPAMKATKVQPTDVFSEI